MIYRILLFLFILSSLIGKAQKGPREAAYEFNKKLGRGINFMATKINQGHHDPYDFELIKKNKFTHIRIGSRVWQYVGSAPDYTIDNAKLLSYKDAVDWALDHDLMVVMDPIHAWYEYGDADLPMLIKLWEQFAIMFADYPIDRVAFEIFNEPRSYDFDLGDMINGSIDVIRDIPGNQERIVIVSGQSFSTRDALIDAFNDNVVFPTDDAYLIGTFHYYDPRPFTKQGDEGPIYWANTGDDDVEWEEALDEFQEVIDANDNWATVNNTEALPIYNGEFGCDNGAPLVDRTRWLWWIRMVSEQMNFSNAIWNLYKNTANSKGMGPWTSTEINNPETRTLDQYVLDPYRNRYEGEKALIESGFIIEPWEGSSDDSLISIYNGEPGNQFTLQDVYIGRSGEYDATLRYQNNGSDTVYLQITSASNNENLETLVLKLPPSQDDWISATIPLQYQVGTDNKMILRLNSNAESFHFDYLVITKGEYYDNLYPSQSSDVILSALSKIKLSKLNIYPNPSSHIVNIEGHFKHWDLYTTRGQKLLSGSQNKIIVKHLKNGLYILMMDEHPVKLIIK